MNRSYLHKYQNKSQPPHNRERHCFTKPQYSKTAKHITLCDITSPRSNNVYFTHNDIPIDNNNNNNRSLIQKKSFTQIMFGIIPLGQQPPANFCQKKSFFPHIVYVLVRIHVPLPTKIRFVHLNTVHILAISKA